MSFRSLWLFFCMTGLTLVLFRCTQKSDSVKPTILYKIDTANVEETIKMVTSSTDRSTDTVLWNVFEKLSQESKFDLLGKYLKQYAKVADQNDQAQGIINLYYGRLFHYKTEYDTAVYYYSRAISFFSAPGSEKYLIRALIASSENYGRLGQFDKSIVNRYAAICALEKSDKNDSTRFTQIGQLGNDYLIMGKLPVARILIDSALVYFTQIHDTSQMATYESAKSFLLLLENSYDSSRWYAEHALALRILLKDSFEIAGAYNTLAVSIMGTKQWSEGLKFLEKAKSIYSQIHNDKELPGIMLNIGHCYLKLNQTDDAIQTIKAAYELSFERKQLNEMKVALQLISDVYYKLNDFENAYRYYRNYTIIKDSALNIEKEIAIQDVSAKYKVQQNEQKLLMISKEKDFAAKRSQLYILLLISVLIMGFLISAFLVVRVRKNRILYQSRQKMQEMELEKLHHETEFNRQALENFTWNMLLKNKLVEKLEEKISEYENKEYKEWMSQDIEQLKTMKILTDDDWKNFKIYFEKSYPGFISEIKTRFNGLTPAELRLLLLIRLNLDSKDTAAMLGISQDSVKKARYRLKKKLGLNENDDLETFIAKN